MPFHCHCFTECVLFAQCPSYALCPWATAATTKVLQNPTQPNSLQYLLALPLQVPMLPDLNYSPAAILSIVCPWYYTFQCSVPLPAHPPNPLLRRPPFPCEHSHHGSKPRTPLQGQEYGEDLQMESSRHARGSWPQRLWQPVAAEQHASQNQGADTNTVGMSWAGADSGAGPLDARKRV